MTADLRRDLTPATWPGYPAPWLTPLSTLPRARVELALGLAPGEGLRRFHPLSAALTPERVPLRPAPATDPDAVLAIFLMALATISIVGLALLGFALAHGWFA